jgi:nitroimidazol reductase NimA-like FMN-containing flavoprotein (pyridoxamine 5'-phosphate oxidase superfamily)
VTLSCGYDGQTSSFYFHCANAGLKLDFIRVNPHVCATVIEDGGYIPGECGHSYRTVVFWGDIEIVPSTEEKRRGMTALLNQLETDPEVKRKKLEASDALYESMVVLKLSITEIHGKAGR